MFARQTDEINSTRKVSHFLSAGNKSDMVYLTRRATPESALWRLIIQTTMMVIFPRWYRKAQETFLSVYCATVCVNSPQLTSADQQSRSAWSTGSGSWTSCFTAKQWAARELSKQHVVLRSSVFPQKVKRIEYLIKLCGSVTALSECHNKIKWE